MKRILLFCALAAFGLQMQAEGYQVNLQGNRQTGMGHTGTGLQLGASSMHFNPGALSFMDKKYEFSFGGSTIFSNNTFQKQAPSVYTAESDNPMGTPAYFYGAAMINEQMSIGLGITTPYGNSLKWGDEWDGRLLIQDISLRAIYIQPTFSYKISDKIGVGVGFVAANGNVELNKALPVNEAHVNISGNTWAYGFNAGLSYKATDKLTVGLNYRSKIQMKVEGGDAEFTVPDALSSLYPNTTFNAELPMPANATLGIGYKINEKVTLAADIQFVEWSAYESLDFDFAAETIPDSENPRNYDNAMVYRLGAEYALNNKFQFRAGVYYDSTPIPEDLLTPETPGTNKIGMSAGASFKFNDKLALDASLLYIHGQKREDGYEPTNFYGTYYSNAIIPGIGINYTF